MFKWNRLVLGALFLLLVSAPTVSLAQWTKGNYVATVVYRNGNTGYRTTGPSPGFVFAYSNGGGSDIKVSYSRDYSAPAGTPDLTTVPTWVYNLSMTGTNSTAQSKWTWSGSTREVHLTGPGSVGPATVTATAVTLHAGTATLFYSVEAHTSAYPTFEAYADSEGSFVDQ